jgi:hypothetical protein
MSYVLKIYVIACTPDRVGCKHHICTSFLAEQTCRQMGHEGSPNGSAAGKDSEALSPVGLSVCNSYSSFGKVLKMQIKNGCKGIRL